MSKKTTRTAKESAVAYANGTRHNGDHHGEQPMVMMAMPDSFATMLKMQPELLRRLKLPPWLLFPPVTERKDQAKLTKLEQQRFLCALNTLIANGTYGQLVDIHAGPYQMHGTQRFLPWHRVYLLMFEQALQAVHPDVTLPYWDWTSAGSQAIPSWLAGVTPTVVTPTQTINVNRFPQSPASLATLASNIPAIMGETTFASFTSQLDGVHGGVHVWVGGTMSFISTAPADILFWMHHANIDRLWWNWQQSPAGAGKNPSLSGAAAVMNPWAYTEPDTRDIIAMGFDYV